MKQALQRGTSSGSDDTAQLRSDLSEAQAEIKQYKKQVSWSPKLGCYARQRGLVDNRAPIGLQETNEADRHPEAPEGAHRSGQAAGIYRRGVFKGAGLGRQSVISQSW